MKSCTVVLVVLLACPVQMFGPFGPIPPFMPFVNPALNPAFNPFFNPAINTNRVQRGFNGVSTIGRDGILSDVFGGDNFGLISLLRELLGPTSSTRTVGSNTGGVLRNAIGRALINEIDPLDLIFDSSPRRRNRGQSQAANVATNAALNRRSPY